MSSLSAQGPRCGPARAPPVRAPRRPAARRRSGAAPALCAGDEPATSGSAASTPLVDAVLERGGRRHEVPFHVPGHKRGAGASPALRALLGDAALASDLTELAGLDLLSSPDGPIAEAQRLAARAWGAEASWLLVNGVTAGIQAAVLATCAPGDALVLPRSAHLAAFNAAALAGAVPVWAAPRVDPALALAHDLTPAALEEALDAAAARGLRVGAALAVSPSYYGVLSDVEGLAAACHARGLPLIVDAAHGAHLGLSPRFPAGAVARGADLEAAGAHKLLGAATQAALLHLRGGRVDPGRVARALQVLQSSSPSYLLMGSLDAARAQASDPAAWEPALGAARLARAGLAGVRGVRLLSLADVLACADPAGPGAASKEEGAVRAAAGGALLDPLRLTLCVQGLGLSGWKAAELLEAEHGVVAEMAGPGCVVFALGIGSTPAHARALVAAVTALAGGRGRPGAPAGGAAAAAAELLAAPPPAAALSPRDALFAPVQTVALEAAAGRVSAELLCPYPPGVPAAFPGERLSPAALAALAAVARGGGRVAGAADGSLRMLRVVAE